MRNVKERIPSINGIMKNLPLISFFILTFLSFGQVEEEIHYPIHRVDSVELKRAQDSIESLYRNIFAKEFKKIERYFDNKRYIDAKTVLYEILKENPNCYPCKELIMACDMAYVEQKKYESTIREADWLFKDQKFELAKKLYEKYPDDKYCINKLRRIRRACSS